MVILDGPQHSSGRPTMRYGARGIATVDITVFGPKVGVHSGNYGNWIPNPAQRLASLLASMKDEDGPRPGRRLQRWDRAVYAGGARDGRRRPGGCGADAEHVWRGRARAAYPEASGCAADPTLNVRGMASAFVGAGARTIIPDSATAAIDIRLVKETPQPAMIEKIRAHVASRAITWSIRIRTTRRGEVPARDRGRVEPQRADTQRSN